jgi:hypothetical protein
MPLYSTLDTLKLLADAIDAEEEKIEAPLASDLQMRLSKRLEWLQARFSAEYNRFLDATRQNEESIAVDADLVCPQ